MTENYSLSQNKLLEDANNIRSLTVNWRSYHQSQMISSEDFEFINELDSSSDKQSVLDKHGKNSAKAFVNLIGQISRDQTVRYLLTSSIWSYDWPVSMDTFLESFIKTRSIYFMS